MSSQPQIIKSDAVPPYTIKPFPNGGNNIYTAGIKTQQNQQEIQTKLIGQNGGIKRKRKLHGGAAPPVIEVKPLPSYTPNLQQTTQSNSEIQALAIKTQNAATFDNTKTQSQVANIAAQQQAIYSGKTGGAKRHGGSGPIWGCLSGGKRTRRNRTRIRTARRHGKKCYTKKHRKNKKCRCSHRR